MSIKEEDFCCNYTADKEKIYIDFKCQKNFLTNLRDFSLEFYWCTQNIKNLGTKWDISFEVEYEDEEEVSLFGDSAWTPPLNGYQNLVKVYPNLEITFAFSEPGCDFAGDGHIYCKDGEIIYSLDEYDYSDAKNILKYDEEDEENE